MARRSKSGDPEEYRKQLIALLVAFETHLKDDDLRQKVRHLVPSYHILRDLGCSLIDIALNNSSARQRLLSYLQSYPCQIIDGDELMAVSGIQDWPRRLREIRKDLGFKLLSGVTVKEMEDQGELDPQSPFIGMKPEQYVLMEIEPDREAAYRYNLAKEIRQSNQSVQNKILAYLRQNVGRKVSGEELRYVSRDKTEWARRTRELRTEQGWPVVTRYSGAPKLEVGTYLLEMDRQSPVHDRRIPDPVRRAVLRRDKYECQDCHWHIEEWNKADPRILELHHIQHHVDGGRNTANNLLTLCNVCHDSRHRDSKP